MYHIRLLILVVVIVIVNNLRSSRQLHVVVIGAGPVGLIHAIAAARSGAKVTVIEKRLNYSRSVWFDLYPKPWYPSIDILQDLQFEQDNNTPYAVHEYAKDRKVVTIQAKTLETFLAKSAQNFRVQIMRQTEFVGINYSSTHGKRNQAVALSNPGSKYLFIEFDVLLGADGSKSKVRELANIDLLPKNSFLDHFSGEKIMADGLKQIALVVDFRMMTTTNGSLSCPTEKTHLNNSDEKLNPWTAGFYIPEVSTVYKRFYFEHCQLQVFLNHRIGDNFSNSEDLSLLKSWDILMKISQIYLDIEFETVEQLKMLTYESSMMILHIQILAAASSSTLLDTENPGILLLAGGMYSPV